MIDKILCNHLFHAISMDPKKYSERFLFSYHSCAKRLKLWCGIEHCVFYPWIYYQSQRSPARDLIKLKTWLTALSRFFRRHWLSTCICEGKGCEPIVSIFYITCKGGRLTAQERSGWINREGLVKNHLRLLVQQQRTYKDGHKDKFKDKDTDK